MTTTTLTAEQAWAGAIRHAEAAEAALAAEPPGGGPWDEAADWHRPGLRAAAVHAAVGQLYAEMAHAAFTALSADNSLAWQRWQLLIPRDPEEA